MAPITSQKTEDLAHLMLVTVTHLSVRLTCSGKGSSGLEIQPDPSHVNSNAAVTTFADRGRTLPHRFLHSICQDSEAAEDYLPTACNTFLLQKIRCTQLSRKSQHFTQNKFSLPHSQEPDNCPYPEPDQFHASSFKSWRSLLILHFHYAQFFQVVSFLQVWPPKSSMYLSCLLEVPHILFIVFLIWSTE
jgi:hypothetical protein